MSLDNGLSHNGSNDNGVSLGEMNGTCISVRSLWKVYGNNPGQVMTPDYVENGKAEIQEELGCVVALQGVSFDVSLGETFVVIGLSGRSKSTLVRCLIRLIEPTAVGISIDREDLLEYNDRLLTEFRRHKSAMVFQHFGLLPHRTIIDNAAWGLEVRPGSLDNWMDDGVTWAVRQWRAATPRPSERDCSRLLCPWRRDCKECPGGYS